MPKYQDIINNHRRLRALTGFCYDDFNRLLPYFREALAYVMDRQNMDGYRREGRRFTAYRNSPLPTTEDKLLFILTYLKVNPTQEVHGQMFGMSQSNVSKWFHILHNILNEALRRQDFLPARSVQELSQGLQNEMEATKDDNDDNNDQDASAPPLLIFFHDGTERPINRPGDNETQKFYFSGKSHQHAVKNIIIADTIGTIPYLSPTYEGKAHDKRIADESGYTFPAGSLLYQDMGFEGFKIDGVIILQPKKKPKGGSLTPEEKAENKRISSIRIHIEHVIGSVKRFSIVREVIRIWCDVVRDKVMETCCGLHNFLLSCRINANQCCQS